MSLRMFVAIGARLVQIAFAGAAAGMLAYILMDEKLRDKKWIFATAVSGVSIVVALVGLVTCRKWFRFQFIPDIIICAAWFAAFGLLYNYLKTTRCGAWHWDDIVESTPCSRFLGSEAFSMLSGLAWAATALVGIGVFFADKKEEQNKK